jgi:phosphoribosylaminoimidazole-succinocarboxamide synthase
MAAEQLKLLPLAVVVRVVALTQMEKARMAQEEEAVAVDIFSLLESL